MIGKPMLFSLTNSWAKFYQVDTLRTHAETEKNFSLYRLGIGIRTSLT